MKQMFDGIAGNEKLRARLGEDLLENRLSHAYIIEGAAGTGKHTLALSLAAALSCERRGDPNAPLPCRTCPSCQKILSGNSPDVILVKREEDKATLGIGVIRGMRSDVHIAPNDNEIKVYIVSEAHLMTPEAQNALLLTLEEPPPYVLFLLLCEKAENLLETVRSRAPVLRTQPLEREQILSYLLTHSPEAERLHREAPLDLQELIAAGNGSIGGVLSLLSPATRKSVLERRQTVRELLSLAASGRGQLQAITILTKLSKKGKREGSLRLMNGLQIALRDLMAVKLTHTASPLCFFARQEEAEELSDAFGAPSLLRLCGAVDDAIDKLQQNANVHLTLFAFASRAGLI